MRAARKCAGEAELNESLRDRILRKLEALSDERGYQVLDYVEFLESKYAERANTAANPFTRFTEAVEDKLRSGRVSASVIAETMGLLNKATSVLSGVAAAGKSVATDIVTGASDIVSAAGTPPPTKPAAPPPTKPAAPPPAAPPHNEA